jgi:superfamily II DNA or RNA helicase
LKIFLSKNLRLKNVPADFREDLTERLSFPNPKWLENVRMGRWNRGVKKTLRFYRKLPQNGLRLPRGYIRQLIQACKKRDIPIDLVDERRSLPDSDFRFSGHLKPFQEEATTTMLSREFGLLCAPTGSGKTVMALAMVAQRRQPALIVVHTRDLADQWVERIQSFLKINRNDIGFIGGGRKKIGREITVALVQSLYKCADEVSRHVGFLIVDESHRCPSRTFTEAVSAFDARYMLGLSATPYRRDNLSKLIFWYLGDLHHEVDSANLVNDGHIMPAEVIFKTTDFTTSVDPIHYYSKMLSELTTDVGRNHLLVADIAAASRVTEGVCLVLSDRKAHCENLRAQLRYDVKLQAEVLTGDLTVAQRRETIMRLHNGQINILIATGQLIGEGFDCPALSTLFLTTPIKFSGRVLQYIGRILRPSPGKKKALIYDYVDARIDVLTAAARSRMRVYRASAWEVHGFDKI